MIDVNLIRQNPDAVKIGLKAKNIAPGLVDDFLALDENWRNTTKECDDLRAQLNALSKERKIEDAKVVKGKIKELEGGLAEIEKKRGELLDGFPNLPDSDWPVGKDENENKVLREVGEKPKFDFKPSDYLMLAEKHGIVDTERAAKVVGTRFGYLFKEAVLLELALVQFAFEKLIKKGFTPVIPPVMIKPDVYKAMGRLAGAQEEERYRLKNDDLYLVGSAEHTIGPIHMDEVLDAKDLPRRYVGFSTCFRREAGSYGKDTKGILRVHQFDKVEMFSFADPEKSREEHQFMLAAQEELMKELGFHYRVVQICTGDMGWTDAAQYDIEVWLPGQNQYRETQSCSNTTDFQARGINCKFRISNNSNIKPEYLHTLNATAFPIGRMLIAIIENFQQKDRSIAIPKVLQKYTGFKKIG